jgi:hypothetical protein
MEKNRKDELSEKGIVKMERKQTLDDSLLSPDEMRRESSMKKEIENLDDLSGSEESEISKGENPIRSDSMYSLDACMKRINSIDKDIIDALYDIKINNIMHFIIMAWKERKYKLFETLKSSPNHNELLTYKFRWYSCVYSFLLSFRNSFCKEMTVEESDYKKLMMFFLNEKNDICYLIQIVIDLMRIQIAKSKDFDTKKQLRFFQSNLIKLNKMCMGKVDVKFRRFDNRNRQKFHNSKSDYQPRYSRPRRDFYPQNRYSMYRRPDRSPYENRRSLY